VLSTDKAVYPINAMGMSKAMMEKLMVAKARMYGDTGGTIFCGTRYGNVMASRGSVIPLFISQMLAGNPITVTDPNMTRFMMTIDDAVDLVLYAFEHGNPGDIFVQKAPAATIETLAQALGQLFDITPKLQIIGTRHGEKLYETLLNREEMAKAEDMGGYFRVPADVRDLNYGEWSSPRNNTVIPPARHVLITGANGFIGKNLRLHLAERKDVDVVCFIREHSELQLPRLLQGVDLVFHLAGVNRPLDPQEYIAGNTDLTRSLSDAIARSGRKIPVVYASSIQAVRDNPYGLSKRAAEEALFALQRSTGASAYVFRLPNVFGKWCKPNYNSAVATFCHNIARGLPIHINDPMAPLTLVYVDDVIERFIQLMDGADQNLGADGFETVAPQYTTTVGELAWRIRAFKEGRSSLVTERVGTGLVRALYSTYLSFLPPETIRLPGAQTRRPAGRVRGNAEDSGLWTGFLFHGPSRRHPGWTLPPQQDGEIPRHQGDGAFQVPAHVHRRNTRTRLRRRECGHRRDSARLDARHHQCRR
jgi:nucleoside-diphosphate-sugar epimerase